MGLTVKQMIELNNEKRELLTSENKEYYENILVYIRLNNFRDDKATEEVLLEMLEHLLEAQKEGKSAEAVFGKSPKELADEIKRSLPKESFKSTLEFSAEILLSFFSWFLIPIGIFTYFFKDKAIELHLYSFLVYFVALILIFVGYLGFALKMINNNAFNDKKRQNRQAWIFGLSGGLIITAIFIGIKMLGYFGPKVEISSYTILGLGCFFLLASYLFKKIRETK